MSRRKQLNPRAMKEEGETNKKRMKETEESRDEISSLNEDEEDIDSPTIQSNIKTESQDENLIQCALCDGQFNSVALLQMHTITFHIPTPSSSLQSFLCPQCNSSLPSMSSFALHMKCHLSERLVNCPICGKSVREEEEYLDHLADHLMVKSVNLSCSQCHKGSAEQTYRDENEFLVHSMEKHARLQIFCTICSKIFGDDFSFKIHSMSDHSETFLYFHCVKCEKSFNTKGEMHSHLQSVHSSSTLSRPIESESTEDKEFRILHCSVCDEECRGENALDEHRLFTHCKIIHSDACGECHLPLSTQSQFIDHCEAHATDSHMSCVVCKQNLRSVAQLNVHAKFHAFEEIVPSSSVKEEKEEKSNESPISSLILPIPPSSLIISKPLSPSKVFRCHICGFRFNSQSRLDTHIRKHTNSMSATCQICGDQFKKQDQLVMHMQTHKLNLTERAREGLSVNGI